MSVLFSTTCSRYYWGWYETSCWRKVKQLNEFYKHLKEPGWKLQGYGDKKHEIDLLENFDRVIDVFMKLKPKYQVIISDITKEMGFGMAKYLESQVISIKDWEEYCHYVAGVVGEGLSKIFAASGLENPKLAEVDELSNDMALFLQKTNIIRDYLDDISQKPPRVFYPKDVWNKYAIKIEDFSQTKNYKNAVTCANELITDAMKHSIRCLDYMKMLKDPSVFRFCAIPQVMAISTIELCYNNVNIFRWEVKIRKGEAIQMIMNSTDYNGVCKYFYKFACKLERKIPSNEPNGDLLLKRINELKDRCISDLKN